MLLQIQIPIDNTVALLPAPPPPPPQPWGLLDCIYLTVAVLLGLWLLSILFRPKKALKSWHHSFAGLQLSAREFSQKIIGEIRDRKIPDIDLGYEKFFEAGIFSPRREYLSIDYKKFSIDICCIAYGTGYYVSWWLGEKDPGLLSRIPILKDLFGLNPDHQSYYQLDTATLFQSSIHDAILKVIDEMTKEKGIRPLTELERQPFNERR